MKRKYFAIASSSSREPPAKRARLQEESKVDVPASQEVATPTPSLGATIPSMHKVQTNAELDKELSWHLERAERAILGLVFALTHRNHFDSDVKRSLQEPELFSQELLCCPDARVSAKNLVVGGLLAYILMLANSNLRPSKLTEQAAFERGRWMLNVIEASPFFFYTSIAEDIAQYNTDIGVSDDDIAAILYAPLLKMFAALSPEEQEATLVEAESDKATTLDESSQTAPLYFDFRGEPLYVAAIERSQELDNVNEVVFLERVPGRQPSGLAPAAPWWVTATTPQDEDKDLGLMLVSITRDIRRREQEILSLSEVSEAAVEIQVAGRNAIARGWFSPSARLEGQDVKQAMHQLIQQVDYVSSSGIMQTYWVSAICDLFVQAQLIDTKDRKEIDAYIRKHSSVASSNNGGQAFPLVPPELLKMLVDIK
jgi:hypothetical protein